MWPRTVEIMLGLWLAVSPFVFRHSPENRVQWATDLACALLVIGISSAACWHRLRYLSLANVLVGLYLMGYGYLSAREPAQQNDLTVGLLVAMFAIIPSDANNPPEAWTKFEVERQSGGSDVNL